MRNGILHNGWIKDWTKGRGYVEDFESHIRAMMRRDIRQRMHSLDRHQVESTEGLVYGFGGNWKKENLINYSVHYSMKFLGRAWITILTPNVVYFAVHHLFV